MFLKRYEFEIYKSDQKGLNGVILYHDPRNGNLHTMVCDGEYNVIEMPRYVARPTKDSAFFKYVGAPALVIGAVALCFLGLGWSGIR
jgi:hypothetical protein